MLGVGAGTKCSVFNYALASTTNLGLPFASVQSPNSVRALSAIDPLTSPH